MKSEIDIDSLKARSDSLLHGMGRVQFIDDLVAEHSRHPSDSEEARELRALFLLHLEPVDDTALPDRFGRFLAEEIETDDLEKIEIEAPEAAPAVFATFHRFRFDDPDLTQRVHQLSQHLLRVSLQRFERRGELGRMFSLLQVAPPVDPDDHELARLRMRAQLHEGHRARRRRRILYAYLVIQALMVTLVFPWLFVNSENGRIQAEVAEAVDVNLESGSQRQSLTYVDGLYWSVVTATSIGYGDITPRTNVGRGIAATLGTMGVITIGVLAGLVLSWITPRRLEG